MCIDRPNLVAANEHLHRQLAEALATIDDLRAQLATARQGQKETTA